MHVLSTNVLSVPAGSPRRGKQSDLHARKKGDMDDDLLPRLVDLLLRYRVRMTDGDVRDFTAEITEALVASRDDPAIPDRAAPAAINSK